MVYSKIKQRMGKISLLMILVSLVIATGISTYDFFVQKGKLEADFHNSISPIPGRMANIIEKALWFMDMDQGINTIETEMKDKRIFAVLVKEVNGKLFLGKRRDPRWQVIDSDGTIPKENYTVIEEPIVHENEPIGKLEVYFTERFVRESLKQIIIGMFFKAIFMTGIIVGFLMVIVHYYLVKPIYEVTRGIEESKKRITSFSKQMMKNSQSLTINASKQAGMVEETASSLEQMSAMTQQNAANVRQSNQFMEEALQMVTMTKASMEKFMDSIKDITSTSEKTSKIVKNIEDIAFQTNLLSLNAAVEAAHAGESGAGFAVVAEEVRNLANRSSTAAKNTAELIGESVEKIQKGEKIADTFRNVFENLERISHQTKELLAQIDVASKEQAEGIALIASAMTQIDKQTQNNMIIVDRTIESIQDTNCQVKQMSEFVTALSGLIGGHLDHRQNGNARGNRLNSPPKTLACDFRSHKLIPHRPNR